MIGIYLPSKMQIVFEDSLSISSLYRSMFKSKENILVTSRLVNEVKSLNPKFETAQINGNVLCFMLSLPYIFYIPFVDAGYRFFRTKKDAEKCRSKGTDEKMKTNKRHHERIVRVSNRDKKVYIMIKKFFNNIIEEKG